jgi:long-chain fatty acid transport protein
MRKKKFVVFILVLPMLLLCSIAFANVDQLSNMSAEWIRTGNRNAATDSTDIVIYNPAGLTKMSEGFHLNIGNQSLFRKPEHSFDLGLPGSGGKKSFEQDDPDYFLPNFYMSYNEDDFAIFGGYYIPGGGATVDYPNGSVNTRFIGAMTVLGSGGMFSAFNNDYLEATSIYLTSEIGAAYRVNDRISLAVALRYIRAENEVKAGATMIDVWGNEHDWKLKYDTDADGLGGVVGINISPRQDVNIGLRYETRVKLEFETDLKQNDFPEEFDLADYNEKNRRDFPAMFGIGVEYRLSPKLTTEMDFNWYFQEGADWGKFADGSDISEQAGDCWSLGGTFGYQINEAFLVSIGTIYTKFEWNDIDAYYQEIGAFEVLYTDNWHFGTGFAWKINENVTFNFALGQTIWEDKTIEYVQAANNGLPPVDVRTENSTTTVALGFDLAF